MPTSTEGRPKQGRAKGPIGLAFAEARVRSIWAEDQVRSIQVEAQVGSAQVEA